MTENSPNKQQRPQTAAVDDVAIELVGINKHFGPVH
ncbi:hypothetical protein MNBD_ALPHA11-1416, partial [hydrothermal vent metagenome]